MAPSTDIAAFHTHLRSARRIVSLCGAGLSASSGLPTFRGAGGMWRNYEATSLATPEAFKADPGLVWQFYSMRRHMALQAAPNPAHYALAEGAKRHDDFVLLTQNVDGLSSRAGHSHDKAHYLHGSLFSVKCSGWRCDYAVENYDDPIVPALEVPLAEKALDQRAAGPENVKAQTAEYDESAALPALSVEELPQCPKCSKLLRPGVVWFGENLDKRMLRSIDKMIKEGVDLCIVIGTSGTVHPAASYARSIKNRGGKIAVVDLDVRAGGWSHASSLFDWVFEGDAAKIVPELLEPLIGEVGGGSGEEAE